MKFFVDANLQDITAGKETIEESAQGAFASFGSSSNGEEASSPSRYYLKGPFMECNIKNGNGRYYPYENVVHEMERFINEDITQNRAVGECDHPAKPEVNLDKIAILIEQMNLNENYQYMGKARVLNTPMGKLIQTFIDEGVQIGVSTRALGSLRERNGYKEVQKDFRLIAVDAVHGPSAPNSFVQGLMEGKEFFVENGIVKTEEELRKRQREVEKATKKKQQLKEQAYLDIFERVLKNI